MNDVEFNTHEMLISETSAFNIVESQLTTGDWKC